MKARYLLTLVLLVICANAVFADYSLNPKAAGVSPHYLPPKPLDYDDSEVAWGEKSSHYQARSVFAKGESVYFIVSFKQGDMKGVSAGIGVFNPGDNPNSPGASPVGGASCSYWEYDDDDWRYTLGAWGTSGTSGGVYKAWAQGSADNEYVTSCDVSVVEVLSITPSDLKNFAWVNVPKSFTVETAPANQYSMVRVLGPNGTPTNVDSNGQCNITFGSIDDDAVVFAYIDILAGNFATCTLPVHGYELEDEVIEELSYQPWGQTFFGDNWLGHYCSQSASMTSSVSDGLVEYNHLIEVESYGFYTSAMSLPSGSPVRWSRTIPYIWSGDETTLPPQAQYQVRFEGNGAFEATSTTLLGTSLPAASVDSVMNISLVGTMTATGAIAETMTSQNLGAHTTANGTTEIGGSVEGTTKFGASGSDSRDGDYGFGVTGNWECLPSDALETISAPESIEFKATLSLTVTASANAAGGYAWPSTARNAMNFHGSVNIENVVTPPKPCSP